jgi:glycine/D-amino acid oxidase-like deaminating enzyme
VTGELPATADAVVVGAGLVGAATAASLAATGRGVCVVDRAGPLGGTTAAGEGNILVSDKLPGPELTLALRSIGLWRVFAAEQEHGDDVEFEPKGGVVAAHDQAQLAALHDLARRQRAARRASSRPRRLPARHPGAGRGPPRQGDPGTDREGRPAPGRHLYGHGTRSQACPSPSTRHCVLIALPSPLGRNRLFQP